MDSLRAMTKLPSPALRRKASGEGNATQVQVKVNIVGTVYWTAPPGPCVAYSIQIQMDDEVHHIARSYADIRMLHEQLSKRVRGYSYELPQLLEDGRALSRHFFTKRSHADLLESYLTRVAVNAELRQSRPFIEFLELDRPTDGIDGRSPSSPRRRAVSIDDFSLLRVLGEGCMGKVFLARFLETNQLYALKVIRKEWVFMQRELEHTMSERDILVAVGRSNFPFLVTLHWSFQTESELFLVLDYCPGGDLATQLTHRRMFPLAEARFYASEIILGLQELHRRGIIYRDLKPENILLDKDGHIVLTDFGLSKQFSSSSTRPTTRTFCGTAEYLAPEILQGHEYTFAVDWFSLGALLYEMLVGVTPFYHDNHQEMYRRVMEAPLVFPRTVPQEARHLLAGLMDRNPKTRLGARLQGAQEVKNHPFFAEVDWTATLARKVQPPFKPRLISDDDVSNFDPMFTELPPVLSTEALPTSTARITLTESMQEHFKGFSFVNTQNELLVSYHHKRRSSRSSDSSSRSRSSSTRSFTRPESFEEPLDLAALRRMLPTTTSASTSTNGSTGPSSPALRAASPIAFANCNMGGKKLSRRGEEVVDDVFDGIEGGILLAAPDEGDEESGLFEEDEDHLKMMSSSAASTATVAVTTGHTTLAA